MSHLRIFRGISGSGKTTAAIATGLPYVEADMWFSRSGAYNFNPEHLQDAHNWCFEEVCKLLASNQDCCVSNTNLRYWELSRYIDYCMSNNHTFSLHSCFGEYVNVHNVPADVLLRQRENYESDDVIMGQFFRRYDDAKLYTSRKSLRYPDLTVLKYKREVFYKSLWTPELTEMRGRVVDATGKTVINPLTKVFNYKERGTVLPDDAECLYITKINGFMGCLTRVDGELIASTTGSLDSEYVSMIWDMIPQCAIDFIRKTDKQTFIFEITHPLDPHIIEEVQGAWLLGIRHVDEVTPYSSNPVFEEYLDNIAAEMSVLRPSWAVDKFATVRALAKTAKHEGFMVYSLAEGAALKLKTLYYLTTKFLARMRAEKFSTLRREALDEEFYALYDYLQTVNGFVSMSESERLCLIRDWFSNGD